MSTNTPRKQKHLASTENDMNITYYAPPSDTTSEPSDATLPFPPMDAAVLARLRERFRLCRNHKASYPYWQFMEQVNERQDAWGLPLEMWEYSCRVVRQRWIQQEIWDERWDRYKMPFGGWKHERECGNLSAVGGRRVIDGNHGQESTRPLQQFEYQVAMKRKQFNEHHQSSGCAVPTEDHFAELVREIWKRREIWNDQWGGLPGDKWNHEIPLEDWLEDRMGDDYIEDDEGEAEMWNRSPSPELKDHEDSDEQRALYLDTMARQGVANWPNQLFGN